MTEVTALRAVLFDLDGTLVRTFIDFPAMRAAVMVQARDRFGVSRLSASDTLEMIAETLAHLPESERSAARQSLYSVVEECERHGCAAPEAIPGAEALLRALRARDVRVGIVTRNARAIASDLVTRMRLPHDTLVAREDTASFKPDPEPVRLACTRLGVEARHCAMVGDLWADVAAGAVAGCALTIGIQWATDPAGRFERSVPSFVVGSLEEAGVILIAKVP